MAKLRGVDAKLTRLRALRHENIGPEVVAELRQALGHPSCLVAAEAAEIAGERMLAELASDLAVAFERFMIEPEENDKFCRATFAIVQALNKLDYKEEQVFLRGIRHVQEIGVWGAPEPEDKAAALRGESAFGLVRINHRDVLNLLVDLLADRDKVARLAAAQALGATGAIAAVPLLRYKTRAGDPDPTVTAECLAALLSLTAESLPFVVEYLHGHDRALQEGAAFALGESRRPEALPVLLEFWPRVPPGSLRDVVLLAVSMLRLPAGFDFLLDVVAGKDRGAALAAVSALAIHRHNAALRDRVAAAIAKQNDAALQTRFQQKFTV